MWTCPTCTQSFLRGKFVVTAPQQKLDFFAGGLTFAQNPKQMTLHQLTFYKYSAYSTYCKIAVAWEYYA